MIRLTEKTQQDFLNKKWVERLQNAGVKMIDNKYWLTEIDGTTYITEDKTICEQMNYPVYPTYTLAELHYKLSEWHPEYKGLKLGGPIQWKDAPFYFALYEGAPDESPYSVYSEYPLYAAAQLLINCAKNGAEYVEDVSDK